MQVEKAGEPVKVLSFVPGSRVARTTACSREPTTMLSVYQPSLSLSLFSPPVFLVLSESELYSERAERVRAEFREN